MIESAACNMVSSVMDWQHKAEVSNSITDEENRSKLLETPYT
jgi:hypothetical protein